MDSSTLRNRTDCIFCFCFLSGNAPKEWDDLGGDFQPCWRPALSDCHVDLLNAERWVRLPVMDQWQQWAIFLSLEHNFTVLQRLVVLRQPFSIVLWPLFSAHRLRWSLRCPKMITTSTQQHANSVKCKPSASRRFRYIFLTALLQFSTWWGPWIYGPKNNDDMKSFFQKHSINSHTHQTSHASIIIKGMIVTRVGLVPPPRLDSPLKDRLQWQLYVWPVNMSTCPYGATSKLQISALVLQSQQWHVLWIQCCFCSARLTFWVFASCFILIVLWCPVFQSRVSCLCVACTQVSFPHWSPVYLNCFPLRFLVSSL